MLNTDEETSSEWAKAGWQDVRVYLGDYTGTVRLRLGLEVDRYLSDKGWILDDFVVRSDPLLKGAFLPLILRQG